VRRGRWSAARSSQRGGDPLLKPVKPVKPLEPLEVSESPNRDSNASKYNSEIDFDENVTNAETDSRPYREIKNEQEVDERARQADEFVVESNRVKPTQTGTASGLGSRIFDAAKNGLARVKNGFAQTTRVIPSNGGRRRTRRRRSRKARR
jgi:hypothetical protein